ncbi:hypothetical protein FN846DRAFT_929151 [Sphaerosporella brunnea]|uniref:Chromo domain-containing protein n=1 Tax=Sphaerosporella brunnea TaxID=1250544 RepID=A0A5J5F8T5_9PEZI|nr:hypothetical protein FN846DRAFT_929151 [Sphaerosporella brunnea]
MDYLGIYVRWLAIQHAIQDDGTFVGLCNLLNICEPKIPEVLTLPTTGRPRKTKIDALQRLRDVLRENDGSFGKELETRVRCGTIRVLQERYKVVAQNGNLLICLCMHGGLWDQWLFPLDRILKHRIDDEAFHYLVRWAGYGETSDTWIRQDLIFGQQDVIAEYWIEYWKRSHPSAIKFRFPVTGHAVLRDGSLSYRDSRTGKDEEVWSTEVRQSLWLVEYRISLPAAERQWLERFVKQGDEELKPQAPQKTKHRDGDVTPTASGPSPGAHPTIPVPYAESVATTTEPFCTPPPSEVASDDSPIVPAALQHLILPRLQSFLEFHCHAFITRIWPLLAAERQWISSSSAELPDYIEVIEGFGDPPGDIAWIRDIATHRTPITDEDLFDLLAAASDYVDYLQSPQAVQTMHRLTARVRQRLEKYREPEELETKLDGRREHLEKARLAIEAEILLADKTLADVRVAKDRMRRGVLKKVRDDVEELLVWDLEESDDSWESAEVESAAQSVLQRSGFIQV